MAFRTYLDDYASNTIANYTRVGPDTFSVVSGQLRAAPATTPETTRSSCLWSGVSFADGTIEADLKSTDYLSHYPEIHCRESGGQMVLVFINAGNVAIYENTGTWTMLATPARAHNSGTAYRIKVTCSGSTVTVWENGTQVWTGTTGRTAAGGWGPGYGTNNSSAGNYAWFDNLSITHSAGIPTHIYRESEIDSVTAGGTDGTRISEGDGTACLVGGLFDREADLVGAATKLAIRSDSGTIAGVSVTPTGTNADRWSLSSDGTAWGAWGAGLSVGSVGTANVVFYARARGLTTDAVGRDTAPVLAMSAAGQTTIDAQIERRVVPHIAWAQDASLKWYPRFDFGDANFWEHDTTNHGDLDVIETIGATTTTYSDVGYASRTVSGATVTLTATVRAGLTLTTRYIKRKPGSYKVEHSLASDQASRVRIARNVTGPTAGASSAISTFFDSATAGPASVKDEVFQAAALHRGATGVAVALVAGDGWENLWNLYAASHTADTSWYNRDVVTRGTSAIGLNYGYRADSATGIHLRVGQTTTLWYALACDTPVSQREINLMLYRGLYDAYVAGGPYSDAQKVVWSTARQLLRIRRNEADPAAAQWFWPVPSSHYEPNFYPDATLITIGMNESGLIQPLLDTYAAASFDDAASPFIGPGDSMTGARPFYDIILEAYAKKILGYTPTPARMSALLAEADAAVAHANKILPATWGGFEEGLTFVWSGQTITTWSAATSGVGSSATRVGVNGGVTPHGGSYQGKLTSVAAGYARFKAMRFTAPSYPTWGAGQSRGLKFANFATAFCEPTTKNGYYYECTTAGTSGGTEPTWPTTPGATVADGTATWTCRRKAITVTAWVNIPSAFASGGFRIHVYETGEAGGNVEGAAVTDHYGTSTLSTAGWQQVSYTFTPNAATAFIAAAVEVTEAGIAYVDDVQIELADAPYDAMLWDWWHFADLAYMTHLRWAPNSGLGLRCYRSMLGASWTAAHQAHLDKVAAMYPGAFFSDASANKILNDRWHPVRKTWTFLADWAEPQYYWYLLSENHEKILSDAQVAALYAAYPAKDLGAGYGAHAFPVIIQTDGAYTPTSEYSVPGLERMGEYQNGGSWLRFDGEAHKAAEWAGVADAKQRYQRRLLIEFARDVNSHEFLNTSPSIENYGTCPADQRGYGWNAVILMLNKVFYFWATIEEADGTHRSPPSQVLTLFM